MPHCENVLKSWQLSVLIEITKHTQLRWILQTKQIQRIMCVDVTAEISVVVCMKNINKLSLSLDLSQFAKTKIAVLHSNQLTGFWVIGKDNEYKWFCCIRTVTFVESIYYALKRQNPNITPTDKNLLKPSCFFQCMLCLIFWFTVTDSFSPLYLLEFQLNWWEMHICCLLWINFLLKKIVISMFQWIIWNYMSSNTKRRGRSW